MWNRFRIFFLTLLMGVFLMPVGAGAFLGLDGSSITGGSDRKAKGLSGARDSLNFVGENVDEAYKDKNTDLDDFVEVAIKSALSFVGTILLVIIVYAGYLWLLAQGNQDKVDKAKKWIFNSVIGLLIISLAWILTAFVLQSLRLNSVQEFGLTDWLYFV